jgi:hypothetical protein
VLPVCKRRKRKKRTKKKKKKKKLNGDKKGEKQDLQYFFNLHTNCSFLTGETVAIKHEKMFAECVPKEKRKIAASL